MALLIADVSHKRLHPKTHALCHKVYYLCLSLDQLHEYSGRFFSHNRFNLLSFYDCDHGFNNLSPRDWINSILADWNLSHIDGEIVLLTMPRVLGFVFNPVSFWFCFDKDGALRAVISEVNNTFGERHCYLSFHPDHRPITASDWLEAKKVFHVSPFLPVKGHYRFRFAYNEKWLEQFRSNSSHNAIALESAEGAHKHQRRLSESINLERSDQKPNVIDKHENALGVWIDYHEEEKKILATSLTGITLPLQDRTVIACFFRYPLVTFKVVFLIHYHALRLVMKGIRYFRKPQPPIEEITQ